MFQTDLYLPVANRYLTYLIHRNETAKWVSFQYKSHPTHTNMQRRPKEQMLHWLMDIYKMFISFFPPSQSFPLACCVCLAVRLYGGVRGWALISVCLFIHISALAISICGGAQRGGFAGDNSPTLSVRSDGERVIFNRAQRLSGVSMPCSGRPDSSEMVPFFQLWHFYIEWTHFRCLCLK